MNRNSLKLLSGIQAFGRHLEPVDMPLPEPKSIRVRARPRAIPPANNKVRLLMVEMEEAWAARVEKHKQAMLELTEKQRLETHALLKRQRIEGQAYAEEQARLAEEQRRIEEDIILRKGHARTMWRKLVNSRAFQRNANHGWVLFERFLEDVGLPPSEQHTLFKDPSHISYTRFSVRWI